MRFLNCSGCKAFTLVVSSICIMILLTVSLSSCDVNKNYDLNHPSITPTSQKELWWLYRHKKKRVDLKNYEDVDVILMGDSLIHNWENMGLSLWEPNTEDYRQFNLGYAGDRTEHILWRIENGELEGVDPKVLILLVGTNNTGFRSDESGQTAFAIEKIVLSIREKLPNTKIILTALFPREELPTDPLRIINDDINKRIAKLDDGKSIFFLDIGHLFLEESGRLRMDLMGDGLHPGYPSYLKWREVMAPLLGRLMQQ